MKTSFRAIIHYTVFLFRFTAAALFIGRTAMENTRRYALASAGSAVQPSPSYRFVIDPGHGGEDGGACIGDTLEKALNLKVAGCLSDVCTLFGCRAKMPRAGDRMLYNVFHDLEDYGGRKKTCDLRNRLRIAEETDAALFAAAEEFAVS